MNEHTGPVVKKEYTPWESVVWHFKSRKSRLAMVAILTIVLANCSWVQTQFGIKPESASAIATHIVIILAILVGAISGEKIMMNGKAPDTGELRDEILETVKEELVNSVTTGEKIDTKALRKSIIDSVVKRIHSRVTRRIDDLEKDTQATLDKLEGAIS